MKNIILSAIFMVFCFSVQIPLQAKGHATEPVRVENKHNFNDPFHENTGYDKKRYSDPNSAPNRSAPSGAGIGEDVPLGNGLWLLFGAGALYAFTTYIQRKRREGSGQ
jgi:hypothetical protein